MRIIFENSIQLTEAHLIMSKIIKPDKEFWQKKVLNLQKAEHSFG